MMPQKKMLPSFCKENEMMAVNTMVEDELTRRLPSHHLSYYPWLMTGYTRAQSDTGAYRGSWLEDATGGAGDAISTEL